jgi:tetratricopeptide (TPR) repeat protein
MSTTVAGYEVKPLLETEAPKATAEMHYQLGRYFQAQNRWADAARAYERALALKGDHVDAANALGSCYAMLGQHDRAIARLEETLRQAPSAGYVRNNLGYVYYLQGSYAKAIDVLEAVTQQEPRNSRAWRNLGLVYAKAGAPEKSREAYARANRATPHAVLETWRAANPASLDAPAAHRVPTVQPAPAVPASKPSVVTTVEGRTSPSMEVISVAPQVYELRPLQPLAPAAAGETVAQVPAAALPLKPFRVEVSNGNGTAGMAGRIAHSLKLGGLNTVRLTNQRPSQRASEIQFAPGYAAEAAKLAGMLGQQPLTVVSDNLRRDIQVRLVLGKDVRNETAFATPRHVAQPVSVASAQ